jgi:hypothetical protein
MWKGVINMKDIRRKYKGYIIDKDDLGRVYIYNTKSPYTEDCDRIIIHDGTIKAAKEEINIRKGDLVL